MATLKYKSKKQINAAILELPKTRLCAQVVLSAALGESELNSSVLKLKSLMGNNWSHVTAYQFMSGKQAQYSAESGHDDERRSLLLAHEIAKIFCNHVCAGTMKFAVIKQVASSHQSLDVVALQIDPRISQ